MVPKERTPIILLNFSFGIDKDMVPKETVINDMTPKDTM